MCYSDFKTHRKDQNLRLLAVTVCLYNCITSPSHSLSSISGPTQHIHWACPYKGAARLHNLQLVQTWHPTSWLGTAAACWIPWLYSMSCQKLASCLGHHAQPQTVWEKKRITHTPRGAWIRDFCKGKPRLWDLLFIHTTLLAAIQSQSFRIAK